MSSSSSSFSSGSLNGQITERLTRTNYVLWRTQITPQLRGAGFFGYADGLVKEPTRTVISKAADGKEETSPNPLHPIWVREDQQVLGYLLNNLSKEVLVQVTSITHGHDLSTALASMFSSTSMSRINNIRIALANAQQGAAICSDILRTDAFPCGRTRGCRQAAGRRSAHLPHPRRLRHGISTAGVST